MTDGDGRTGASGSHAAVTATSAGWRTKMRRAAVLMAVAIALMAVARWQRDRRERRKRLRNFIEEFEKRTC